LDTKVNSKQFQSFKFLRKHADSGFDGTNVINERTLDYETQKTKNSPHCINSEPKSVPVPLRG